MTSCLGGAQEIGQQLEAAALATRMAMEADTTAGMEDGAAPGATAQQAPCRSAEKESKQVPPCGRPACLDTHMHDVLWRCASFPKRDPCAALWLHVKASHAHLCFGKSKGCGWCVTGRGVCRAELVAERAVGAAGPEGAVERQRAGLRRRRRRHKCRLQRARPVLAVGRLRPRPGKRSEAPPARLLPSKAWSSASCDGCRKANTLQIQSQRE